MATQTIWRNRITRYADVPPADLLANPANWRVHPKHQQDALKGVIDEIGYVDPVLVQDGTDLVIDGHLRVALALRDDVPTIPVQYVDLSDAEAATVLATFDPITALATADKEQLDALLREVSTGEEAVQALLADLAEREGVIPVGDEAWAEAFGALPDGEKSPFEQMTFTLHESQAVTVRDAVSKAKHAGPFDTPNENSNGNAIARICEAYLHG